MTTAFDKTWQYSLNNNPNDSTSVLTQTQSFVWWLKATLTGQTGGITQGLWTCVGSSDTVTAGMDNVDRWTNTYQSSKLTMSSISGVSNNIQNIGSWIVLRSPSWSGAIWYMLLYPGTLNTNYGSASASVVPVNVYGLILSKAPFTGGSTTAFPTSTLPLEVGFRKNDGSYLGGAPTTQNLGVRHFSMIMATDGSFWALSQKQGAGLVDSVLCITPLLESRTADAYPVMAHASLYDSAPGGVFDATGFFGSTQDPVIGPSFTTTNAPRMLWMTGGVSGYTAPITKWAGAAGTADGYDGTSWDFPVYMVSTIDATHSGFRGRIPDFRWSPWTAAQGATDVVAGITYSIQLGAFWLPSNGPLAL